MRCKNCGHEKTLQTGRGFGSINIPRVCDNNRGQQNGTKTDCKIDSYTIVSDKCEYID